MKRLSQSDQGATKIVNAADPTSAQDVATKNYVDAGTTTLTNKTLDNTNTVTLKGLKFTLQDDTDTTKQAQFVMSTIATGTTKSFTFPNSNSILVGTTVNQTLTNKTLTAPVISTISNTGTLTLPTSTDTLIGRATTDTLTNKRVSPRTGTTTSSATPTINTDNVDFYSLTAQAADITSFTTNLSGTPTEAQKLWIAITGTAARAITWGASFENGAVTLPTTTVTTQRLDVGFIWNTVTSKWRCMASGSA